MHKIIIAGGGTGGHIFPAIAIANAIKAQAPDTEFLFVGAKGKMEMEKVPQAGYSIKGIDIAGFNRSSLLKNVGLPFKIIKSFFQVRNIIGEFQPNAVIGVGGYSSFPVLRVAQSKGIKTFIHESNSFAGKSNILLGKKCSQIFVATSGMEQFFPANKIMITGNPVRKEITNASVGRAEGSKFFNLDVNKKTILAIGGSLGAKSINEAIAKNIAAFEANNLQLIWQTGKPFATVAQAAVQGQNNIFTSDFVQKMEMAYAAADVVISRSGAMAMAELCVAEKPTIFVPYPFAAEDHQTANAQSLVKQRAALMINDADAMEKLVATAVALSKDEQQQESLKNNIKAFAVRDADEIIAKTILNSI